MGPFAQLVSKFIDMAQVQGIENLLLSNMARLIIPLGIYISQICGGVVVKWLVPRTFDRTVRRSEGRWFEARLVSSLLCCFLTQETLLHFVSLHPGV